MGWCEKCQYEYEEGIESCSDCGSKLVEELPDKEQAFEEIMSAYPMDTDESLVKFYFADSDEEANSIIALMDYNGIKVLKNPIGAGSYLTIVQGFNTQGIDLYVLESDVEAAKLVLDSRKAVSFEEVEGQEAIGAEGQEAVGAEGQEADDMSMDIYMKERRRKSRLLVTWFYLIPVGLFLCYLLYASILEG